jgi:hypothetical protein
MAMPLVIDEEVLPTSSGVTKPSLLVAEPVTVPLPSAIASMGCVLRTQSCR